MESENHHILT